MNKESKQRSYSPLSASEEIRDSFRRYILSTFKTNSETYNNQLRDILSDDGTIAHGPYLQISHNYPVGNTIEGLITEGVLSEEFHKLNYSPFKSFKLYEHQESAIRKAYSGRNIVVSTGTGSGKTECFLIPILDALMREKTTGTLGSGVRVMLLYPLNALANDQLERMRDILSNYPDITFGTFTGETRDTKSEADVEDGGSIERPANEIYDRTAFRKNPPHILITNYAMLEHLLIKPSNNPLFGDGGDNHWRFVVLDEVHTYTGAKGSEVSLLLRRLKASLGKKDLQFILTSATLGSEEENRAVANFATELCDAPFDETDIIRTKAIPLVRPEKMISPEPGFYTDVARIIRNGDSDADTEKGLRDYLGVDGSSHPRSALYDICYADPLIHDIVDALDSGVRSLSDLSKDIGIEEQDIIDVMDVISATKKNGNRVFNARYHLFVKGLDGAYVTLKGSEKLLIRPQKTYSEDGEEFKVFQISTCYNCGSIFILGNKKGEKLVQMSRQSADYKGYEAYLLADGVELDDEYKEGHSDDFHSLCSRCGSIVKNGIGCGCGDEYRNTVVKVSEKEKVCTCPVCGRKDSRRGLLRQLYLGNDASTAVISSALFKELLHSRDRRFLAFSDSRQSAAFFAPYMESSYRGILMKRIIYQTMLENAEKLRSGVSFDDFLGMMKRSDEGLLDDAGRLEALVRECAQNNSFRSMEYLGFLKFEYGYDKTGREKTYRDMPDFGLNADECRELFDTLVKYIRDRRAVDYSSTDFQPYEHRHGFVMEEKGDAARFYNDAVKAYLEAIIGPGKAKEFAKKFFDGVMSYNAKMSSSLFDLGCLRVSIPDHIFRCSKCGGSYPFSVRGRCIKCNSETLERVCVDAIPSSGNPLPDGLDIENHYVRTCVDSPMVNFRMVEHTAQLSNQKSRSYQNLFKNGKIDALSCSTTFEMGVDIGSLNSVFMRNVPPSPANYVQRAGRSGRGTDASSFSVTFCREASHDATYFEHPEKMIEGKIAVPMIKPGNIAIVKRHIYASALSFYWKKMGKYPSNVKTFSDEYYGFKAYLEEKPDDLKEYLEYIVPEEIRDDGEIDVENFGWTESLFGGDGGNGCLNLATEEFRRDSSDLSIPANKCMDNAPVNDTKAMKQLLRSAGNALNTREAIENTDTLDFLSRYNVIPKYGFPVDVVPLLPVSGKSDVDLSRDLLIAISEYAPGSEVIADGKAFQSRYVTPIRFYRGQGTAPTGHGNWTQYVYKKCAGCGKFTMMIDNFLEEEDDERFSEQLSVCSCGERLGKGAQRFIKPEKGFKFEDAKMSVSEKPRRSHSSEVSFCDSYDNEESIHHIGREDVQMISRSNSRLVAINEQKYLICNRCGFAFKIEEVEKKKSWDHKGADRKDCSGSNISSHVLNLGHVFRTDVLILRFMNRPCRDKNTAMSVLYALLEGFCREFSIERSELSGCLDNVGGDYTFIIFDNTPGGSGYVRMISDEDALRRGVDSATSVVRDCTCGGPTGDTSCYSCLRNFRNQRYHDDLVRGLARDYLASLQLGE